MQRTEAKRVAVVALLTTGALGLHGSSLAAPAGAAPVGDEPVVVTYDNEGELVGATVMTVAGKPTGNGGCSFELPQLELAPDEAAIEARQVETNFTDCTTKVEVGIPSGAATKRSGGRSVTETVKPGSPATDGPITIAATQSAGYYHVWWVDVIGLKVHEVKSNVRWSWDGSSCVWGESGWTDYWWLSETGWSKNSSNQATSKTCDLATHSSSATYRNGFFCGPGVVWSHYDNVRVQGRKDGWLFGRVVATWTTYPSLCPTLYFHYDMRRTQN